MCVFDNAPGCCFTILSSVKYREMRSGSGLGPELGKVRSPACFQCPSASASHHALCGPGENVCASGEELPPEVLLQSQAPDFSPGYIPTHPQVMRGGGSSDGIQTSISQKKPTGLPLHSGINKMHISERKNDQR